MDFKFLNITQKDEITYIELNRPEKYNALSVELFKELRAVLNQINGHHLKTRGVVLSGAGEKAFAAGADIKEMSYMNPIQADSFSALAQDVTLLIEDLPVPVIAAVDGHALGGGCELALACDFIYATEKSTFGQPEVSLGLIPGFGGCIRFVRALGLALAKEYIYSARKIPAQKALELKLVNKVLTNRAQLIQACEDTLKEIFNNSQSAVAYSKMVINSSLGLDTQEGLKIERNAFSKIFNHPEKTEGVSAFLEKRPARF
jgi:enoyl-CoA hydratase